MVNHVGMASGPGRVRHPTREQMPRGKRGLVLSEGGGGRCAFGLSCANGSPPSVPPAPVFPLFLCPAPPRAPSPVDPDRESAKVPPPRLPISELRHAPARSLLHPQFLISPFHPSSSSIVRSPYSILKSESRIAPAQTRKAPVRAQQGLGMDSEDV